MQRNSYQDEPPSLGPPEERTGVLDGFDILRETLRAASVKSVGQRLAAGQSIERIRREVPEVAAKVAERRFPSAASFQESVHAFVRGIVETELNKAIRS